MRLGCKLTLADTNEKPYSCTCGALFARRDLLKRHEGLAHSGGSGVQTPADGGLGEQQQTQEWQFSAPEQLAGYQTGMFVRYGYV